MYPHRLVVDANCINARGGIAAMTALEEYHHAGALELIVTSTLGVELDERSIQAAKAKLYQSVGAYPFFFSGETRAQSRIGAPIRPSLLPLLHKRLFGRNLHGRSLLRAVRDCLHLDQAQMNGADIFITKDQRLHLAEEILAERGISLSICTPDGALQRIRHYYLRTIGKDDPSSVRSVAANQGPVIMGSNSCHGCAFMAGPDSEPLVTIDIRDGRLRICGLFRGEHGQPLLELKAGERPSILAPKVTLTQVGAGPILIAEEPMGPAVVASDTETYLAVRMTHSCRVVFSEMKLRDSTGQLVGSVDKASLMLRGVTMRFLR